MPPGRYYSTTQVKIVPKKKKVLSNKALTQRVRALTGTNGERLHNGHAMYEAVTLATNTPQIKFFDEITGPLFASTGDITHHYYIAHIQLGCTTAGGSVVRIIYGWDNQPAYDDGDDLEPDDILESSAIPSSNYNDTKALPLKEANNKNCAENPRAVIVKDMLIPLIANEKKAFNVKLPLYNKKGNGESATKNKFRPFLMAVADINSTFNMYVDYFYTSET